MRIYILTKNTRQYERKSHKIPIKSYFEKISESRKKQVIISNTYQTLANVQTTIIYRVGKDTTKHFYMHYKRQNLQLVYFGLM